MKPCKLCIKKYEEALCSNIGHCVFEGSGEWPVEDEPPQAESGRLLVRLA